MKTLQEWFDAGYIGLASQGFVKSKHPALNVCLYQSNIGCCFIGWSMPSEFRLAADRRKLTVSEVLKELNEDANLAQALYEFQTIHDSAANPADMQCGYIEAAEANGLTVPTIGAQS